MIQNIGFSQKIYSNIKPAFGSNEDSRLESVWMKDIKPKVDVRIPSKLMKSVLEKVNELGTMISLPDGRTVEILEQPNNRYSVLLTGKSLRLDFSIKSLDFLIFKRKYQMLGYAIDYTSLKPKTGKSMSIGLSRKESMERLLEVLKSVAESGFKK